MQKHLQKLLLLLAFLVPWMANAQTLSEYEFSTGTDASKWITLSSPTSIMGTSQDDVASSVYNLGITFPFGAGTYSQFSVSSNGIFKLGPGSASSSTTAGQFTSSYYNTSLPKICGVARDLGTCSNGYIRYQLMGTAPSRVFVCEYCMGYTYSASSADVKWQVQLYEADGKVVIVYGPTAPSTTPSSFQTGLAEVSNDILIINPSTHALIYSNGAYSTTYSTWHGANRYYQFERPNISCPRPNNLTVMNVSETSFDLTWHQDSACSEWLVELCSGSQSQGNGTLQTVYDTTVSFTGLTANTQYTVYVAALCSNGDTSSWAQTTFRTPCTPYAVPFSETFETFSTSSSDPLPSCWDKHTNYSSNYPYASTSYGHNGSTRSMYMYSTNTTYTYMVLPMFAPAIDSLQVSFWLQKTNTSYAHNLQVGVMNNPADVSTFVPVASVQCTNLYQWEFKEVPLSSYTGSGRFIAIMSPDGVYSYPYLDDLSVTYIPSCHHPYNINVSNITTTSAEVSWLDSVSAGQYVLTYSDGSFSDVETATSSPITLTGLTPNTTYNYTLVSVCNATDSSFAMSGSFTTECIPMDSLPYLMTFESAPTGGSSNYTFVSCWHRLNNGTAYFGYPYVSSSSSYNHTPGGNKGLYWYNTTTTGTYGDYQCVVLPSVDTDTYPINNLQLSFWAKSSSTSYFPVLIVGVMTDPYNINTFTAIDTVDVGNSTEWAEYIVTTNRYEGYGQYVAIKAVRPSSSWYVYVDDVELAVAPACPRVEEVSIASLSSNEVTLNWLEMGSSTSWTVEYGPHGFTPGTGTTTTVYDTTVTLSGLNSNTQYDVYITVECSDPTGAGVNNITFRTSCGLLTNYPFVEDFESQMTGTSTTGSPFIPCWQHLNNGTSYGGYPYVSSSSSYNHTTGGTKGLYWYNTTTTGTYGDYQCLVLPGVDTSVYPINALQLRFWAKSSSTSYSPVFQVGVMTDPTNINTFQQVATANVGSNTNWREFITEFSSFTGYGAYIAVKAVRPSSSWYAYVDDFTIETIPTCPEVTAVQAGNIASTSAAVSWALNPGPGEVVSYEVEVEELGMGSPSTYTTTNQVMLIPNLMPQTTYVVRVRANCDLDGFGGADSVTFTTTCLGGGNLPIVGDGTTTTTYYLPLNNYYNYSYTQEIILASEMSGPTTIQGIRFRYNYSSAVTQKSNCTIYIGHTTLSSLSTSSFVDPSTLTAVYTGPMNVHNGWNDFIFSTPFSYNGTSNLVIAVDDNSGSYPSSSYVYDAYNCSGTLGMHFYSDSENPNPTSTSTLNSFTGSKSTTTYRVAMEMITPCDPTASCAAPNVIVTRVEGDEVDIEWAPGNFETSWTIDYRTHTGSWITVETNYSSTSYTFTNLVPATTYDFRVRHSCDGTTYSATVSALTPCLPMSVPFYEDFENFSTSTADPLPVCWLKNTNYSTSYPYASTTYGHNGGRSMYMYSTSSSWSYMVLPPFQPAIDSLQVSFWLYKSNTSYAHSLEVGVMTDPTDVNTFTLVATVTPSMLTTWEVFDVPLSSYNGNGQYIAIMSPNGVYSYPYLDDLTVDYIPPCPRLSEVTAGHVSTNEASVYWTQMSDATDYLVEYGVHGFPLGYGTQQSTTGDSIRLYSLAAMTTYDVYVSAICAMGDTSEPRLIMITTSCGEINVLPFRQDFETSPTGSSSSSTWVDCWYRLNNGTSYYGYPYVSSSSSYNHTSGGAKGLYWYASTTTGTYGDYQVVILPPIDTTVFDVTSLELSFWAKSSSTSYNPVFQVGVMTDPTDINSFQQVGTVNVGGNTTWTEYTTTFEDFTGHGAYLAIKALRPSSTWYAYVDDIKVDVVPDCPAVSNLVASHVAPNSFQVSWDEEGTGSSWTVEYGPMGFIRGTGMQLTANADSIMITGLVPSTTYDVYVTVDCSTGIGGTNQLSVTTACGYMATLPFTEDFESRATGSSSTGSPFIPCWYLLNNGTSYGGYPYVSTYNHTNNGTKGLYWYNTTTTGTYGDYQCVVLPGVDTTVYPMNELQLSFWAMSSSTSYYPVFQVGVMADPTDINTFQQVATVNVGNNTSWSEFIITLDGFTGSGCHAAIKATRPSSSWYAYVDDIKLEVIPDCPRVEDVAVSNITPTSADISWSEEGEATAWAVEYGPQGFTRGTGTVSMETSTSISLVGLSVNTAYDVYITPDCASGVGGINMVSFRTECEATITLPYTMGFEVADGVSSGSSTNRNFINCWHRLNNATQYFGYPYVGNSTTYAHTGNCGLNWYNTTTTGTYGDYEIVVLPPLDVDAYPINTLQLKFWAKTSSGTPTFQVGVMTDPNNPNSFQQLGMVSVGTNSQWEQYTVGLAAYTGTGSYVAIRSLRASWTAYVDDITLELAPACPQVINVTSTATGTTGALLTWGVQSGFAAFPVDYEVEVDPDDPSESFMPITTSSNPYLLTGLLPGHSYSVRIRGNCDSDGYGAWSEYYDFSTNSLGCSVVDATASHSDTIAGGTTTTYNIPVNNFYNNTFSEQIYLGSELGGSGPIIAISFDYAYSSPSTVKNNCSIYLANTTLSSVTTSTYEAPANMTLVYTGPMNCSMGWNRFEFNQNPFTYSGGNLAVAVVDNSGAYNSSSYVFNAHSASGLAMSWYSDSYQYPNTSMSQTTHAYRNNVIFDIQSCLQMATCAAPLVVVDSIDTNFVAVNWAPGYEETAWDVEYRVAGGTWTNEGTVYTPGYIFTGLTPNQEYEIRITGLCTDSNMATTITVRTPCAPFAVPFHENFASFPTSTSSPLPSCWLKNTNYSSSYPYASTSYSMSGGRSMYMYSTSSTWTYMVLPPFDAPIDTLQVSFWLYRTNTSYTHELQVGVMTDPEDVSTFVQVGSAVPTGLSVWEPFEIPLNNYHGNGQYIAIMSPDGVYSYPYLDELMVEYVSPCPRVRNVATSRIGLHSARVSWDTTAADVYELEYGPAGFTPGTGTRITGIVDDTLTISGLAASTQYDVYVRGLCMPDTSNWSFGHSFFTQCGLIDTVPFFQNFNSIGTSTSTHSPQCWYGTSTYSTSYPYPSSSYSRSGGGAAMYMYLSNTSGYYTMLQLPQVDTTVLPINTLQVSFSLLRSTTSYLHGVIVGVCTGQGMQNFTPIDTVVVTASTGVWQDYEIAFNNYTGYGSYITFLAYAGTESTCYPYLDDILLELIPSCIRPDSLYSSNATSSTVTLGWRERGTATSWEVEYGPAGFTPGTGMGTAVLVSTNPTTIVGLPASFEGDFYVRSICTPGDTSLFSREPCRFSTSQLPATIPYHYNFEDSTEWNAWQTSTNTYIDWARGTAEVDSGNYAMYISPNGGLTYGNENFSSVVNAAVFRDVDFGTIDTSFTFTYRAKVGGTVSARYDALMVFLVDPAIAAVPSSSNITSPWGNVNDLYRISVAYLDTTWSTYTASFDTIHGVKRVAFFWFNQSTGASYPYIGGPAAVDNIHITYSACPRPLNMTVSNVTSSAATLHWDGDPTASYRVAYRVSGASASTNVYVNVNTNSLTLTGLSSTTAYRAWVQKICGSDSSLFSDGVEFQTELCDGAVSVYSYDPAWTPTTSTYAPIGYSFYNYSYVQTIIDSAQMVGLEGAPITAFSFSPSVTNQGDYYNHMDVYMANVPESDLSSGFIMPNTTNHVFVPVVTDGDFRYTTTGWQLHGFDSAFTWDGHSNVLFVINRRHGSYSSGATFNAHSTTSVKTRYLYQDASAYDPTTVTGGTTLNLVGDLKFISCGVVPVCHEPIITGTTHTYENATVTWTGNGTAYEVNIKESVASNWTNADIPVVGNSYTFYGLQPATSYTVRVRQDCSVDSLGYSDWVLETFITDSLPCLPPDSLTVTDMTNVDATFDWVPFGYETMWEVHVWNTAGFDSTYTVSTHPVVLGGYTAGVTYNASVRPLCGSAHNIQGDWGDTVTFTAATCPDVTGLTASEVGASSLRLNWTANPAADSWVIEYGYTGFEQGTGTQATSSTPSYVVTGLQEETGYDFYVRAQCGTDWYSENWAYVSATTEYSGVICDAPTGVSAVAAGNAATVSWTPGEGNISYELEYGPHGFAHGNGITQSATSSPVTIPNLNYETQYDVYVRAFCEQNASSAWSVVTSFTTEAQGSEDCDPVTNLTATEITENSAVISWTAGATGTEWEVVLTNASGTTLSEARTHEQRYQLNGLTPGTSYIVKVRTVCGDDQYSDYASTSFTTIAVGIDGVAEASCTIYPNPTSSATTISVSGVSGKVKIAVVDMNGRTVASELLECSADCTKTMDVERLAQGAYFVRITGENVNMVKKLIVK